jgi:mono/diheme cytochrome c family protein
MMQVSKKAGIFVLLLSAVLLASPLFAQDAASTFKGKCAMCHGADGKGTPTGQKMGVHDFTSPEDKKMSDADLASTITNGKGKMPKYASMSPDDVKAMVAYIRGLQK